jgi:hypothetical protein
MNMFGVMEICQSMEGARFALGIRNPNSKMLRLSVAAGYQCWRAPASSRPAGIKG